MNKQLHFVVVEDNAGRSHRIQQHLRKAFRRAEITPVYTEKEFREKFPHFVSTPPSLFVLDVMVRWTTMRDRVKPPKDVAQGQYHRAGLRCQAMLMADERTKHIPVIFFTAVGSLGSEIHGLPKSVVYIQQDGGSQVLIETIRELLGCRDSDSSAAT